MKTVKTVLISGASGAIGLACVNKFKLKGWRTICLTTCIRSEDGTRLEDENIQHRNNEIWVRFIIGDNNLSLLKKDLSSLLISDLDALVCCQATRQENHSSELLPIKYWNRVIDIDLTGTFQLNKLAAQLMMPRKCGRIINLSSIHAFQSFPLRVAYATAKAGIVGMTQALATEWGPYGITVNAIAPGYIASPRVKETFSKFPEAEKNVVGSTPTGKIGVPEDVADLVYYLASDEGSGHINGQTITIDGGRSKNCWWRLY